MKHVIYTSSMISNHSEEFSNSNMYTPTLSILIPGETDHIVRVGI